MENRFFYSSMSERRSPPCIVDMEGPFIYNLQEAVSLLNELDEENKELKKTLEEVVMKYMTKLYQLEDENKELKRRLELQ